MKRSHNEFEMPSPLLLASLRTFGRVLGKLAWSMRFSGTDNIPPEDGRGLIIASNHQTYLDPYWICIPVYRPLRFMAWDRTFNWFLVGRLIRKMGAFPVNIEKGSVGAMKESLKVLAQGATLVVFPEGARSFEDGKLQDFKPGAARMAISAEVPVLPVTIRGGNEVWPRGRRFPRPGKVEIIYHAVIDAREFRKDDDDRSRTEALTEELRKRISSAL